jgi:hypothetical protein
MSFEAIEQEIATWDDAKLRRLIAYAVVLQDRRDGTLAKELAAKLDDPNPDRWISLEELDRRTGFSDGAAQ